MRAESRHKGGNRATGRVGTNRSTTECDFWIIPAHPLHPAEADLRMFVNTIAREPEHWWCRELRWHRERFGPDCNCSWCGWWAA